MLVRAPLLISHNTDSVSEQSTGHHPTVNLVGYVWQLCESSHLSQSATDLVLSHGGTNSQSNTTPHLGNGLAGVVNRIQIPFQVL